MRLRIKGIVAFIAAIVLAFTMTLGTTSSASASGYTWNQTKCQEHGGTNITGGYDTIVCVEIGWRKQADNSGITATDLWVDVNLGCSELEDYPKIKSQGMVMDNPWSGQVTDSAFPDDGDCHFHRNISLLGPNKGAGLVFWHGEVNLNNGKNFCDYVQMRLYGDGSSDDFDTFTVNGPCP